MLLKQRHDELPKLVETCKQYMQFEQETLTRVMEARARVATARESGNVGSLGQAEGGLRATLGQLFAVAEAYPDLKSNQNFMKLQDQLEGTENRVSVERRRYNEITLNYNKKIRTFPGALFAGYFGFERMPLFEAEPDAKKAPKVKF